MYDELNTHAILKLPTDYRHSMDKLKHWRGFQSIFGLKGSRNDDLA